MKEEKTQMKQKANFKEKLDIPFGERESLSSSVGLY